MDTVCPMVYTTAWDMKGLGPCKPLPMDNHPEIYSSWFMGCW